MRKFVFERVWILPDGYVSGTKSPHAVLMSNDPYAASPSWKWMVHSENYSVVGLSGKFLMGGCDTFAKAYIKAEEALRAYLDHRRWSK